MTSRMLRAIAIPAASEIMSAPAESDSHGSVTILDLAARLYAQHLEMWRAEDDCRRKDIGDLQKLRTRGRIEKMNVERGRIVDAIDELVSQALPPAAGGAPVHTETIGSIIDRLCIARVRTVMLGRLATCTKDAGTRPKAEAAGRQLEELGAAYNVLLDEVSRGDRRIPDWRTLKSYGEVPRDAGQGNGPGTRP
jgi:hypothetical protein